MVIFNKRYAKGVVTDFEMTPRIMIVLDNTSQHEKSCLVTYACQQEFHVKDGYNNFVVKLREKICCNYWNITSLPCKYACSCITYLRDNMENYCNKSFTTEMRMVYYFEIIHPMFDIDVNNRDAYPLIDHPPLKRMHGRFRKSQRKSNVEELS